MRAVREVTNSNSSLPGVLPPYILSNVPIFSYMHCLCVLFVLAKNKRKVYKIMARPAFAQVKIVCAVRFLSIMRSFNIVQIKCCARILDLSGGDVLEMELHQLFYICKIIIVFACIPCRVLYNVIYTCRYGGTIMLENRATGNFKYLCRQIFAVSNDEDDECMSALVDEVSLRCANLCIR